MTQNTPYTPPNTPAHLLHTPSIPPTCTPYFTESAEVELKTSVSPWWQGPRRKMMLTNQNGAEMAEMVALLGGRGSHSSPCLLNVSALCGIGGAFRGCLGGT